ncbi:glycerol ethanol, ferric requiring protein [Umbelopsis sp. WA50703]
MFELTGRVTYILPSMITLIVTKATADWFGKGGIADRYIQINGYPFLDKEEHSFGVPVSHVMHRDPIVMTATGMKLHEIENIFNNTQYQGFPVVQDQASMTLVGYIGRSEMLYLIEKAKRVNRAHSETVCDFQPADGDVEVIASYSEETEQIEEPPGPSEAINFGQYVDQTPITVRPQFYLETVMDLFKKIGPRVILIENLGKVIGLITVKDVLRYIAQIERKDQKSDQNGWSNWFEQRNWNIPSYSDLFNRNSEESHELQ